MKKSDIKKLYYSYLSIFDYAYACYSHAIKNYENTILKPCLLIRYNLRKELEILRELFPEEEKSLQIKFYKLEETIKKHKERETK